MIWGRRRDIGPGAAAPRQSAPAVPHGEGGGDAGHGLDATHGGPAPAPRRRPAPLDGRPGRLGGALVALSTTVTPAARRRSAAVPPGSAAAARRGVGAGEPRRFGDEVVPRAPVPRVPAPAPTWATPSVIVRRPDGSVVPPPDRTGLVAPGAEAASLPAGPGRAPAPGNDGDRGRDGEGGGDGEASEPTRAERARAAREAVRSARRAAAQAGPRRPSARSAVPAYGLRRGAASPAFEPAGQVTATASGAASRAAARAAAPDASSATPDSPPRPPAARVTDAAVGSSEAPRVSEGPADSAPGAAAGAAGPVSGDKAAPGDEAEAVTAAVAGDEAAPAVETAPGDEAVATAREAEDVDGEDDRGPGGEADDAGDDEHDDGDSAGDVEDGGRPGVFRPLVTVGGTVASQAGSARAGVAGILRLVRDAGTSRLLPSDAEAREALNLRLRRAGTYVGAIAVACVLIYAVFPVRTYLDQRAATRRAHEQIAVISEQNDRLEERVEALGTDDEVERIAREDYGMVRPGEESYSILPPTAPTAPTTTTTTTSTTAAPSAGAPAPPSTTSTPETDPGR